MKENKVFQILQRLVEKKGLLQVADILGHSNSLRLKRWIDKGSIPASQAEGIVAILKIKGEIS